MRRILIAAFLLASCASAPQESHTRTKSETTRNAKAFCEVATEMTWAAGDTLETQDEIRSFNAVWKKHCRPEGSPNGKR